MANTIDDFIKRYAEYKASWGSPMRTDRLALIRDALTSFLLEEPDQSAGPSDIAARIFSVIRDLERLTQGNTSVEMPMSSLRVHVSALVRRLANSEAIVRMLQEHATAIEDRLALGPSGKSDMTRALRRPPS